MAAPTYTGNVNNVMLPSPKDLPTVGGLYKGALTVTVPTDLTVPSAMTHLGFIGADGIDEKVDRNTKKIFDWGGDTIASPQENYAQTATFTLMEFLNTEVQKAYNGAGNVTVTAASVSHGTQMAIVQTSDVLPNFTWLWDTYSPGGKHITKFFPIGRVESQDTLKWARTDVLAQRVTVTFFPDATGRYSYTRTDDGVLSAS